MMYLLLWLWHGMHVCCSGVGIFVAVLVLLLLPWHGMVLAMVSLLLWHGLDMVAVAWLLWGLLWLQHGGYSMVFAGAFAAMVWWP